MPWPLPLLRGNPIQRISLNITKEERQLGKALNFGLIYGMGAKRLATQAETEFGVPLTEAEAARMRDRYFQQFGGLRAWHRRQGRLKQTRTLLGRLRRFTGEASFTELLNSPVQGSGADGLKLGLALLWERRGPEGACPVLAVHDEIVIEAPVDKVEEAKAWVEGAMVEGMKACLKTVPVVVEVEVKEHW